MRARRDHLPRSHDTLRAGRGARNLLFRQIRHARLLARPVDQQIVRDPEGERMDAADLLTAAKVDQAQHHFLRDIVRALAIGCAMSQIAQHYVLHAVPVRHVVRCIDRAVRRHGGRSDSRCRSGGDLIGRIDKFATGRVWIVNCTPARSCSLRAAAYGVTIIRR